MTKRPNIVLVFADDLGIGDVSAFNEDAKFQTKNIDYLAKRGIRFTDSHATSALCTPSRYGLLTGRYNWRSRLKSGVLPGDSQSLIEKDRKTIAQLLKEYGYNTAAIGKWHLGLEWQLTKDEAEIHNFFSLEEEEKIAKRESADVLRGRDGQFGNQTGNPHVTGLDIDYSKPITFGPNQLGFDYFYGTPASHDQGPYVVIENDRVIDEPVMMYGNDNIDRFSEADRAKQKMMEYGAATPTFSAYELPEQMQNKAMEKLDEFIDAPEPFFLYYPSHLVHGPILPHERFRGKSGVGDYGDYVLQLDDYVGEMITKLEKEGEFDNTLFVFTSDNGVSAVAGLEDLREQGHDSSAGFRGHKFHIWEGGHREPTIVSYPDMIEGDQVSNHMISHSDLYQTVADLLGAEVSDDEAEDSISNLSLWQGKEEPVREDIIHSASNGGFSIRRDFWKLIMVEDGGVDRGYDRDKESFEQLFRPTELYDLRDDISETNNVIDQHPEVVEELSQALKEQIQAGRTAPGENQENEPDLPGGDWEQLAWMDDYEDYITQLNSSQKDK